MRKSRKAGSQIIERALLLGGSNMRLQIITKMNAAVEVESTSAWDTSGFHNHYIIITYFYSVSAPAGNTTYAALALI